VLAANWQPARLAQLAILGNSFATYQERWAAPGFKVGTRPQRLLALVHAGGCCQLPRWRVE
jgi:hypothetical protein